MNKQKNLGLKLVNKNFLDTIIVDWTRNRKPPFDGDFIQPGEAAAALSTLLSSPVSPVSLGFALKRVGAYRVPTFKLRDKLFNIWVTRASAAYFPAGPDLAKIKLNFSLELERKFPRPHL